MIYHKSQQSYSQCFARELSKILEEYHIASCYFKEEILEYLFFRSHV